MFCPQKFSMRLDDAGAAIERIQALNEGLGAHYAIVETAWSSKRYSGSDKAQATYIQSNSGSLRKNQESTKEFICYWGLYDPKLSFCHKATLFFYGGPISWF